MAFQIDLYGEHGSYKATQSITVDISRNAAKARAVRLAARERRPVDVFDLDGRDDLERYVGTASPWSMIDGAYFRREI